MASSGGRSATSMSEGVAERFERRPAEEIARLRVDLLQEMHALLFWIGQFAAFTAVLSFMLRNR